MPINLLHVCKRIYISSQPLQFFLILFDDIHAILDFFINKKRPNLLKLIVIWVHPQNDNPKQSLYVNFFSLFADQKKLTYEKIDKQAKSYFRGPIPTYNSQKPQINISSKSINQDKFNSPTSSPDFESNIESQYEIRSILSKSGLMRPIIFQILVQVLRIIIDLLYQTSTVQVGMDSQEQYKREHLKAIYTKTTIKKKEQLIDLVQNHNYTIYKASKMLKISNSTAKSVILNFQKYGVILRRNTSIQFKKNQMKKEEGSHTSSNVKVEDKQEVVNFDSNDDSERLRILQNMGLTFCDVPINSNMPFYNYPLE